MYPVCAKIKARDHVCHLYASHAEHVQVVSQFCLAGLKEERGKVLCLFAEPQLLSALRDKQFGNTHWQDYRTLRQQEILEEMRSAGYDVNTAVTQGNLVFHSSPSLYMHNDVFSTDKMLDNLVRAVQGSVSTVRLWCDALFYAHAYLDTAGAVSFYEFEHKLSRLHHHIPHCCVLCCYDRRLFSAPFLQRAFAAHPRISTGTKYYKHNVYYINDNFLDFFGQAFVTPFSELHQSKPALDNWIDHLERHRVLYQKQSRNKQKPTTADQYISSFISNMRYIIKDQPDLLSLGVNVALFFFLVPKIFTSSSLLHLFPPRILDH